MADHTAQLDALRGDTAQLREQAAAAGERIEQLQGQVTGGALSPAAPPVRAHAKGWVPPAQS